MDSAGLKDLKAVGAPGAAPAPALFAIAVFASAALVFIVQPMLTRMILPRLGGSSMVWNTSVAFFQAALLAGYAYAHLLQRLPTLRRQMVTHLAVLLAAGLALPLRISGFFGDPAVDMPAVWLVAVLTVSIGAPFAALSATAPLIQAWYGRIHGQGDQGRDPYVLYAASNLGSLLALLAYPLAVEPFTRLGTQSLGWSLGYGAFACLIVVMILAGWRLRDEGAVQVNQTATVAPIAWRAKMTWLLLAAAPSSLLLGVTGHISADVASAPFLWVAPLALYLVTFIIAFQTRRRDFEPFALFLQIILLPEALLLFAVNGVSPAVQLPVHLAAFFFTAQVCAFALARLRPPKEQLTAFYLWMSLGGVLGGSFNAFVAPLIFNGVWEYPIILILACLARPRAGRPMYRWETACLGIALACCAALLAPTLLPVTLPQEIKVILMLAPALCVLLIRDHARVIVLVLTALALGSYLPSALRDGAESYRSFFGVIQLKDRAQPQGGSVRVMVHGSTIHGTQLQDPVGRCRPTTYYTPRTPMGQVFSTELARRPGMDVGVVGLGSGSVGAYVRRTDTLKFFEIDPAVVRIALDPSKFSYVRGCAQGPVNVVLGDARLQLERVAPASFDLLLVDAFSSDSVPTHLMTVEAMAVYLRVLKPGGVVMLHLSNRNMDLGGPAEAAMRRAGGAVLQQLYYSDEKNTYLESSSHVLVAAKEASNLAPYTNSGKWVLQPREAQPWTDDYVNVAGAIWSRITHRSLE
jgi:spermidine synthase